MNEFDTIGMLIKWNEITDEKYDKYNNIKNEQILHRSIKKKKTYKWGNE
jgi:hypothetical protein